MARWRGRRWRRRARRRRWASRLCRRWWFSRPRRRECPCNTWWGRRGCRRRRRRVRRGRDRLGASAWRSRGWDRSWARMMRNFAELQAELMIDPRLSCRVRGERRDGDGYGCCDCNCGEDKDGDGWQALKSKQFVPPGNKKVYHCLCGGCARLDAGWRPLAFPQIAKGRP